MSAISAWVCAWLWCGRHGIEMSCGTDLYSAAWRVPVLAAAGARAVEGAALQLCAGEDAVQVAARSVVGAGAGRLARGRVGVDGHHRRSALRNSWASENYKMRGLRKLLKIEVRVLARTAVKSLL